MSTKTHTVSKAKNELVHHWFDYLLLVTGSVFFLLFLNLAKGDRDRTFIMLVTFASLYSIWGMIHHSKDKSFHLKSVLEYILISFTTVLLLLVLIYS